MNQQLLEWAKQALEMLNDNHHLVADNEKHAYVMLHLEVIEKGKALLMQPEPVQEPVATLEDLEQEIYENTRQFVSRDVMEWMLKRYYTTPPAQPATEDSSEVDHGDELTIAYLDGVHTGKKLVKREWVWLTDDEQDEIAAYHGLDCMVYKPAFHAIKAKLKEKNT